MPIQERPARPSKTLVIWLIVATAFFMENLDGTVIATALPQMARSFGTNPVALSIGMTSYLVSLAVFIPVSGWVADRFGTRSVFSWAVVAFTVSSVLCALSGSVLEFTAARIVQGIAGAMMVPVGRLVVLHSTEKKDLVNAMSFIVWPGLVAPVIGPPLGGFFATYLSWHWIFLLNVPLGIVGVFLIRRYIPNVQSGQRRPLDVPGFFLTALSLSGLMIGVELLGQTGSHWVYGFAFLAASALLGVFAVRHLNNSPHPLTDLAVLRVQPFRISVLPGTLSRTTLSVLPFLMPLMFQLAFGMNAFMSGLLFAASMVGNLGMKIATTQTLRRFGFRGVLIGNNIIIVASIILCGLLTADTPILIVIVVMLVSGLTRSMQFTSLTSMAFCEVPQPQMSSANTLFSTTQQLSLGLGIALGAVTLHLAAALRGATDGVYNTGDFRFALFTVATISLLTTLGFMRLKKNAGSEVTGHRAASAKP
jgi:EmrB/QacA subfamily drug resistance transporter